LKIGYLTAFERSTRPAATILFCGENNGNSQSARLAHQCSTLLAMSDVIKNLKSLSVDIALKMANIPPTSLRVVYVCFTLE
jgi:hypothetical protein